MNGKRDCKNCIHKVPVFDEEEGIWRGADCDAWECNFVSRAEALKAYEERTQGDLNNAIKTIKAICKDNNTCNTCPMNWNCNEQPAKWVEAKGGAE